MGAPQPFVTTADLITTGGAVVNYKGYESLRVTLDPSRRFNTTVWEWPMYQGERGPIYIDAIRLGELVVLLDRSPVVIDAGIAARIPIGKFTYTDFPDGRSDIEKRLWELIGPPLYYCAACRRAVKVTPVEGAEPVVERPCEGCNGQIIAPRKAVCAGKGGMSLPTRLRVAYDQAKAAITGRCA